MAITIVATAGSASANSFATEVEAIAYMAARLNASSWTTTTGTTLTETEKAALVEATRDLSNLTWDGRRTDTTQVLAWPREYATNHDDPNYDYFDNDVIPSRVRDATIELAFQYIKAGTTDVAALDANDGVIEKTVDMLTTRWAQPYARKAGLERYPRVLDFIRPLLAGSASDVVRRVVRG